MKMIYATYEIQTPMFLGDQTGKCPDHIRPPSFKSALRFWWRALQWSKVMCACNHDQSAALKHLYKQEASIFGVRAESGGQGKILLVSVNGTFETLDYASATKYKDKNKEFLAYGMKGNPKEFKPPRSAIAPQQNFTVKLVAKASASDTQIESVNDALVLLGLIGSLGAKERKGYGSLAITKLKVNEDIQMFKFSTISSYTEEIKKLLNRYPLQSVIDLPPYSALSSQMLIGHSSHDFAMVNKKYRECLTENKKDHLKEYFGLPRKDYGKGGPKRRASPLFIHIHNIKGKEVPVLILIPAIWYPAHPNKTSSIKDFKLPKSWISEQISTSISF